MASRDLAVLLVILALGFFFSCGQCGVEGTSLSIEEDLELEKQLMILNKPAVKTIQTGEKNIFDCVDINKQPAFDHPLLKGHKIQMKPSFFPKEISKVSLTSKSIMFGLEESGGCPPGTVPIRRVRKEDLIKAKSLSKGYATKLQPQTLQAPGHHLAIVRVHSDGYKRYYGAQADINVQNPRVPASQYSEASIWIVNGNNNIRVGWSVNPKLYGDDSTHLSSHWTADGGQHTGCFNVLCPGFVQVDSKVAFGDWFPNASRYRGDQYVARYQVIQDPKTKNWWFVLPKRNVHVGYWPKSIFTNLATFATDVHFGGEVYNNMAAVSPPMGTGHFPKGKNFKEACFFSELKVVDQNNKIVDPDEVNIDTWLDSPECYMVEKHYQPYRFWLPDLGHYLLFGGPGGDNCGT